MKKSYLIIIAITLLIVAGFSYYKYSENQPPILTRPDFVQTEPDAKTFTKIIYIAEDEDQRFFLSEDDITKTITSKKFQKSGNWSLIVYPEAKNKETHSNYQESYDLQNEKNLLKIYPINNPGKLWSTAVFLTYDHKDQTLIIEDEYFLDEKGNILASWNIFKNKNIKEVNLEERRDYKTLCTNINNYLNKIKQI